MSSAAQPIRVLLVEDHADYRESLKTLLTRHGGFDCAASASAEEALAVMEEQRFDVVVMDIKLQGMDGIRCTRAIKERWPRTQVLMCTVNEDDAKIFDALKAGAMGYVIKRAPIQEIIEGVKQVFDGGSPMSAGIARKVVGSFQKPALVQGEQLSERETEVLDLLAEGLRMKEIAGRLDLSVNTVRTHVRHIYEKLQVQSRTEALNKAKWPRGAS